MDKKKAVSFMFSYTVVSTMVCLLINTGGMSKSCPQNVSVDHKVAHMLKRCLNVKLQFLSLLFQT